MFKTFRYLKKKLEANRATQGNFLGGLKKFRWRIGWGETLQPPQWALRPCLVTTVCHFFCSFMCIYDFSYLLKNYRRCLRYSFTY